MGRSNFQQLFNTENSQTTPTRKHQFNNIFYKTLYYIIELGKRMLAYLTKRRNVENSVISGYTRIHRSQYIAYLTGREVLHESYLEKSC